MITKNIKLSEKSYLMSWLRECEIERTVIKKRRGLTSIISVDHSHMYQTTGSRVTQPALLNHSNKDLITLNHSNKGLIVLSNNLINTHCSYDHCYKINEAAYESIGTTSVVHIRVYQCEASWSA